MERAVRAPLKSNRASRLCRQQTSSQRRDPSAARRFSHLPAPCWGSARRIISMPCRGAHGRTSHRWSSPAILPSSVPPARPSSSRVGSGSGVIADPARTLSDLTRRRFSHTLAPRHTHGGASGVFYRRSHARPGPCGRCGLTVRVCRIRFPPSAVTQSMQHRFERCQQHRDHEHNTEYER